MIIARDVMDSAAALLNDNGKELYTYVIQLPYVKIALKDLVADAELDESSYVEEIVVLTVPAGVSAIGVGTTPALPVDFRSPIDVEERPVGSNQFFQDMKETEWDVQVQTPGQFLSYWNFREGEVKFPRAARDLEIRMKYIKDHIAIQSENSVITFNGAESALHYKVAGLLARFVGSNAVRGNELDRMYTIYLRKFLSVGVKERQAFPVTRPGFREPVARR